MNAIAFRSEGQPFGCTFAIGVLRPGEGTHTGVQERLSRKDADGMWIWDGTPHDAQILQSLRAGRPIASVEGASMLVLHPKHEERWDKCASEVYWGAVEALYAADPDAPSLDELLGYLDRARKPKDPAHLARARAEASAIPWASMSEEVLAHLRSTAETFVRCGRVPEQFVTLVHSFGEGLSIRTALAAAQLAAPRERRALVEAAPSVGLPNLLL